MIDIKSNIIDIRNVNTVVVTKQEPDYEDGNCGEEVATIEDISNNRLRDPLRYIISICSLTIYKPRMSVLRSQLIPVKFTIKDRHSYFVYAICCC